MASATGRSLDLASHVSNVLRDPGESAPRPILGDFVAEDRPGGRVELFWRVLGQWLFGRWRRHCQLCRYARLMRPWSRATRLRADAPEPYVA